jgi:organic hydroperoxide reductase OsmC/OhrA
MSAVTHTIRNGVDTEKMFATLDLIKAQPELAKFQFRASNRWIDGSHNRSTIKGFYAAGGEDTTRSEEFVIDAGEPAILLGTDTGANPAEYLLHALAACLTTSIVYVAAARKWSSHPSSRPSPATWTCAARSASTTSPATGSSASACRSA